PGLLSLFMAPATAALSPLSLHDALPICAPDRQACRYPPRAEDRATRRSAAPPYPPRRDRAETARLPLWPRVPAAHAAKRGRTERDRKSTRLNSSHVKISYAVCCLKTKTI